MGKRFWTTLAAGVATATATAATQAAVRAIAESPDASFPAFRVELDAEGRPGPVAAFMGLADGTQGWVDSATGRVRGGAGDAFYADMAFTARDGGALRGGLRALAGADGSVQYTGGAGLTVAGKAEGSWEEVAAGTLVAAEEGGPHSWNGGLALFITNATTPWTPFGRVPPDDLAALATLADAVAQGPVPIRWTLDTSMATAAEKAVLARARERLPRPAGLEARVADGGRRFAFDWPPHSHLAILAGDTLAPPGPVCVADGWHEETTPLAMDFGWEEIGLAGRTGFVALTQVGHPDWTGRLFTGKWRMGAAHTGQRLRYWFDFDHGTGVVAVVHGSGIADSAAFSQLSVWRETANSLVLYYGRAWLGTFYYLGFAEDGAAQGRFMSRQISATGAVNLDWGTFELTEGWDNGDDLRLRALPSPPAPAPAGPP